MNKIALLVIVFGLAAAQQDPFAYNYNDVYDNDFTQDDEYHSHQSDDKDYDSEPHYSFGYEVHDDHTGDIKSHYEERKGEHTQGMYTLVEPGGSKRVVQYFVKGKSGFNAKVEREETKHPQGPSSSPSRAYHDETSRPTHDNYIPTRQYHDGAPPSKFGQRIKPHFSRKASSPPSNGYHSKPVYNHRPQDNHQRNSHGPMSSFSLFNSFKNAHSNRPPSPHRQPSKPFSQQSLLHSSFQPDNRQYGEHRREYDDPSAQKSHATSSVKFVTNGASLSTVTNHVMPESTQSQYY